MLLNEHIDYCSKHNESYYQRNYNRTLKSKLLEWKAKFAVLKKKNIT